MPTQHTVSQGEYLSKIADAYGFPDYKVIWNHAQNAALKAKRKNPNVLHPGDVLYIPDPEIKEVSKAVDQRHRFKVHGEQLKLRLKVLDVNHHPVANVACTLIIDENRYELTTNGQGVLEKVIPRTASNGRLIVRDPSIPIDLDLPVQVGHLDPIEEKTGQQARLNNLGYFSGAPGADDDVRFRQAVEEFQRDNDLTVDGDCGPQTQAKLKTVYGC